MTAATVRFPHLHCPTDVSGQQGQRIHVLRPDHDEVTAVQGRHIGQLEPFGHGDNRGVSGPQRKALIRIRQVGHPRVVSARQVDGRKVAIRQGSQEQRLHAGTGFAGQEVADLGDDGRWYQQFAPSRMQRGEQLNACLMVRIIGQGGGYQRRRRRSRRMTESVPQQVLRPSGDIIGRAFSSSEPGRRPWALPDRPKMTADVIEHRRDFLLRKLLDQPKQLLTLHAHDPSVRSKVRARRRPLAH